MCVSSGNAEPGTLNFQGKQKATSQKDIQGQLEVNCLLLYSANRMENDIHTLSEEKGSYYRSHPIIFLEKNSEVVHFVLFSLPCEE